MKKLNTLLILLTLLVVNFFSYSQNIKRQEWQWRTTISTVDNKGSVYNLTPFLWIPPSCQKITAVLVASTAVLEQNLVEDPYVRAACAKHNIAILWSSDNFYHDDATATGQIQSMLNAFASLSGYSELKTVPWVVTGHSGTNPMPRYIVKTTPNNIAFCIINKATAQCGTGTTVPILTTQGEFMEWNSYSRDLKANITTETNYADVRNYRSTYSQPVSYFFDPNTGHFDSSPTLLKNMAWWMDDIATLRFDAQGNMKAIDQTKGWICGLPCVGYTADAFLPIPYTNAATATLTLAQVKAAAWFPSQRTAQAAYDMANVSMNRTAQVTGFVDANGQIDTQSYWWRAIMLNIPYTLNADGHSVTLTTAAYTRMPNRTDYISNATGVDLPNCSFFNNTDNSFTNSGNPSQIEVNSGNWVQTGANTFELIPRFKSVNYFCVRQQGDATYRSSVQAGNVNLPTLTTGTANVISFPVIANQDVTSLAPITLGATSTAGVTVRYFISSGAAHITNGQLIVDKDSIPPRTHFPMPITVTAYHLGTVSPAVQTATAVSRTFYITSATSTPNVWYVSPTGTGDGSSWNNACSLSNALVMATFGDAIYVKGGDYALTTGISIDSKGFSIYGGFAGNETKPADRSKTDLDNNGIVEPWEFTNATRILGGRNSATPTSFTVLKVTGGSASDIRIDGVVIDQGLYLGANAAGLRIDGKCTFANSIVRNCRSYNATGNLSSNSAAGIVTTVADATIDACLIENCEIQPTQSTSAYAGQGKGAGVWVYGTIQNSVVRNNRILYDMIRPAGNSNTLYYNPYLYGAGIYMYTRTAKVSNCAVYNNEIRVVNWDSINYTKTQLGSMVVRGVGISAENGGSIINSTITNNKFSIKHLTGEFIIKNASSGGQGVGVYLKNSSAATNYDAYITNTVAWGNYSSHTAAADQQIRLDINTTSTVTPAPYFAYSNNITSTAVTNLSATNSLYFVAGGQLIDLAASNTAALKAPQFKTPTTDMMGAVWGTSVQSLDSLAKITKANWSLLSNSYLIGKGTTTNGASTADITGALRNSVPSVGAYEGLNFSVISNTDVPAENSTRIHRNGNTIYHLEMGDVVTVFDLSGSKLESFVATASIANFKSTGFVIIYVQQKSGNRVCIK